MSLFVLANEIEEGIQPIEMEEGNHKTIMSISLVHKPYQNWENVLKKSLRIIGCRISFFGGGWACNPSNNIANNPCVVTNFQMKLW